MSASRSAFSKAQDSSSHLRPNGERLFLRPPSLPSSNAHHLAKPIFLPALFSSPCLLRPVRSSSHPSSTTRADTDALSPRISPSTPQTNLLPTFLQTIHPPNPPPNNPKDHGSTVMRRASSLELATSLEDRTEVRFNDDLPKEGGGELTLLLC